MRLRIGRSAEREMDDIFVYWAKRASIDAAIRQQEAFEERFALLLEQPMIGRECEEFAPHVRCFLAGKYLIYYRKTRTAVEILHVLHGARDQKVAFRGDKPSRNS